MSIVESVPSINLPVKVIVSAVVGNAPTSTSTNNPFAPALRSRASCKVDLLIANALVSSVITPLATE